MRRTIMITAVISAGLMVSGCAQLMKLAGALGVQKPTARVVNASLDDISFSDVTLLFDIRIKNPNAIGLSMAGMDYSLKIDGHDFFSGEKNAPVKVAARDSSLLQIPVTLKYKELYEAFKTLINQKEAGYTLQGGLRFDLPGLGMVRVPLEYKGKIPILTLPQIKLAGLSLSDLSWSSAVVDATFEVKANGGLALNVDKLQYKLDVGGRQWVTGTVRKTLQLNGDRPRTVTVPIKLNFLDMGRAVYDMLMGNSALEYRFSGGFDVSAQTKMLKPQHIRFDQQDTISLIK